MVLEIPAVEPQAEDAAAGNDRVAEEFPLVEVVDHGQDGGSRGDRKSVV